MGFTNLLLWLICLIEKLRSSIFVLCVGQIKKASSALLELTYATEHLLAFSQFQNCRSIFNKWGGHPVCPTHLNRTHSGPRAAIGTCRICVSARGMNFF